MTTKYGFGTTLPMDFEHAIKVKPAAGISKSVKGRRMDPTPRAGSPKWRWRTILKVGEHLPDQTKME